MTTKEWVESNPLRTFRKANRLSLMEIASRMGVGLSAIQTWERGVHIPTGPNMGNLSAIMEDAELEKKWAEWYEARPFIQGMGLTRRYDRDN